MRRPTNLRETWEAASSFGESCDTREDDAMKIKNVFDLIFSMENLYGALEDASRGRRYQSDVLEFNSDAWDNLKDLREEIISGSYRIERYYIFYIHEPKLRMIMSIAFKHRIVQWAIYRVVNPMLVPGYIEDSYGCIPGRGSLSAMKRLKYWLEFVNRKEGETWFYLKLDISKYFYRVSHRILKKVLAKKIKDKRLLELLYGIIDCQHTPFGLPPGMKPEDVPLNERLFDVGMPIGNLLSQMFANIYLDMLDQFCKRVLGIRYYIRYMDDVIILSCDKVQLREWKDRIGEFLEAELELNLNNKTCIRPIGQGIEFVGYRVWADRVVLRKSTTLRIKRSLSGVRRLYANGRMPLEKVTEIFTCYIGMLKHTDSQALIDKLYEDMVLIKGGSDEKEEKEEFVPMLPQEDWYLCYELYGVYEDMCMAQQMRTLP
nr:reverse transcriptase/maturase family protein [uncultured Acetatifactor sp.]